MQKIKNGKPKIAKLLLNRISIENYFTFFSNLDANNVALKLKFEESWNFRENI